MLNSSQSLDHLDEILIQQNFSTDSSMRVDIHNRNDNIIAFVFSFALSFIIFITIFFGERHFSRTSYNLYFLPNSNTKSKLVQINGLNCYNLFISLTISLYRNFSSIKNQQKTLLSIDQNNINISTIVMSPYDNTQHFLIFNKTLKANFKFKKITRQESDTKLLFYDKNLYRSSYFFDVNINGNLSDYSGCQLTCTNGNRSLTFVLISIRSCFFIVSFILLILFLFKTKNGKNIEQKLTIALIIFALLTDFPTAVIHRNQYTFILLVIYSVLSSLFNIFSHFSITIIFNSVRMQKKQISPYENLIISTLFIAFLVIDIISTVSYEIDLQHFVIINRKTTKIYVEIACDTVVLFSIAKTALSLDETEVFRFIIYFVHSIFMIFVAGTSTLIRCFDVSIELKTTMEMMEFASLNIFMIIMSYCHWPCEQTVNRKNYNSSSESVHQKIIVDEIEEDI